MDRPSPHFTWDELTIRGGVRGVDLPHLTDPIRARLIRIAAIAEAIRMDVGRPVHVTSGYRHGDEKQHGAGQAMDIQVEGMSPLELIGRIRGLSDAGKLPHPLRETIAETRQGTAALSRPMVRKEPRWVHIATIGLPGEPYSHPDRSPWTTSADGNTYLRWSP